jgi:protein-S-isoprenylcysteine O-methyltransferase Ste14
MLANGFLRGFLGALPIVALVTSFAWFPLVGGGPNGWPFIGLPVVLLLLLWEFAAILKLGLRRSFLYVRMDDPLITTGPYAYHRHPQLTASVLLIFAAIGTLSKNYNEAILGFQSLNFLIFAVCVVFIIRSEEKDLVLTKRFGDQYRNYRKAVPIFQEFGRKKLYIKFRFVYKLLLVFASFIVSIPLLMAMRGGNRVLYTRIQTFESYYCIDGSEAKTNLASITTSEIAHFMEYENWGMTFDVIGWAPQGRTKDAYFLNSCDVVLPSDNGFKDCPTALKEYFQEHPLSKEDGFHAAAVFMPTLTLTERCHTMKIWVIDKEKKPTLLLKTEVPAAYPPMSRKSRDILRRRGPRE